MHPQMSLMFGDIFFENKIYIMEIKIKIDQNLYADSLKAALKVDFLKSSKELKLYAASIYNASMWARGVDRKNRYIRSKRQAVK
jgi:hypothetical protein